jgi:hypothetical protein
MFIYKKDDVTIGPDSRYSEIKIIFYANVFKTHRLSNHISEFDTETATSCEFQTRLFLSQHDLLELNQLRQVRAATNIIK